MKQTQNTQTLNRPTLSGLTRKTSNIQTRHKRPALHGLVIVGVLVAVAVAMTFALTGNIQDNLDSMTGSNRVAITSINAYTAGDRLVVTGNIQNLGSQPLTSVTIDEISAGTLVITQDNSIEDGRIAPADHGKLTLAGELGNGNVFAEVEVAQTTPSASNAGGTSGNTYPATTATKAFWGTTTPSATAPWWKVDVTGFSVGGASADLEALPAGSSKSFRIVVTGHNSAGNAALDILETVPASTQLFMTISATDGSTSTISDPRSVRVTAR